LLHSVNSVLLDGEVSPEDRIQRATLILTTHTAILPSPEETLPGTSGRNRSGLAQWRIAKIQALIDSRLHCGLTTESMADHVGMSMSRFCHAFKASLGDSPHRYLMMRRVARARELLLTSNLGLSQIASDCGLADQAHFNRLFRRFLGCSPGAWRRENAGCEAMRIMERTVACSG
jgi:AraC family transcriptional regulator